MKRTWIFCFLISQIFLTSPVLYAEWEHYAIEKQDGGVAILGYQIGSKKTVNEAISDSGYPGQYYEEITIDDIPKDKTDRKYWKLDAGKIEIDQQKKNQDQSIKDQQKAELNDLRQKLGLTQEEFDLLKSETPE